MFEVIVMGVIVIGFFISVLGSSGNYSSNDVNYYNDEADFDENYSVYHDNRGFLDGDEDYFYDLYKD